MRRRACDGEAYPSGRMASRLRFRRIICFLKHQALDPATIEVEKATGVFFDAGYFGQLMRRGWWDQADTYLHGFLPGSQPRSRQAIDLIIHVSSAKMLASIAAGGRHASEYGSGFDCESVSREPRLARCRDVVHKMHADQARAFKVWREVAPYAVNVALDMVAKCPDLKGKLHLPHNKPMPWEVTPLIGARDSQRRRSKPVDRTPVDITRAFLRQQRSLSVQETAYSGGPGPMALFTKMEQIIEKPIILGRESNGECGDKWLYGNKLSHCMTDGCQCLVAILVEIVNALWYIVHRSLNLLYY